MLLHEDGDIEVPRPVGPALLWWRSRIRYTTCSTTHTIQPFVSDKLLTTLVVTLALTMVTFTVTAVTRSDSGGTHNDPGDAYSDNSDPCS